MVRLLADLSIISVSVGGWETSKGLEHFDQILSEKPDLVIWEYAANDSQNNHFPGYLKNTQAAIDRLKAAGIEVALHTVTPSSDMIGRDYFNGQSVADLARRDSDAIRTLAASNQCALADMHRAFTARGILYVGDLYSDYIHPNHLGHEMMADVLEAMLTDKPVAIWKHGPAAERTPVKP